MLECTQDMPKLPKKDMLEFDAKLSIKEVWCFKVPADYFCWKQNLWRKY